MIQNTFFLKLHKQLLAYNHIHIISKNTPLSVKAQKDLWVKMLSSKKKPKKYGYLMKNKDLFFKNLS